MAALRQSSNFLDESAYMTRSALHPYARDVCIRAAHQPCMKVRKKCGGCAACSVPAQLYLDSIPKKNSQHPRRRFDNNQLPIYEAQRCIRILIDIDWLGMTWDEMITNPRLLLLPRIGLINIFNTANQPVVVSRSDWESTRSLLASSRPVLFGGNGMITLMAIVMLLYTVHGWPFGGLEW